MGGPGTAVRVTPSRRRADEWAVVLAAADIRYRLRHRLDGWALIVPARDAAAALEALDAYDRENNSDVVDAGAEVAPSRSALVVGLVVTLLLIAFFVISGEREGRSGWFEDGSADAERMLAGEWWRAVTALTLHADVPHLLGNAVAGVILVTAVCRSLGPGLGLWLVLLAGAGGNVLTAAAYGGGHASVGASTAIFGAIGVLAVLRIFAPRRVEVGGKKWWVVVAASLALLAMMGAAPNADSLAHLFGLLVGGGLGLIAGLTIRGTPPDSVQWALVAAAGAAVLVAWALALTAV
jgi:membrane associated rhomboid family serine protease